MLAEALAHLDWNLNWPENHYCPFFEVVVFVAVVVDVAACASPGWTVPSPSCIYCLVRSVQFG